MIRTQANREQSWNYGILCVCGHCGAKNWISNHTNKWKCWACDRTIDE